MDWSCKQPCCADCADLKIKHTCICHIKEELPNLGMFIDKELTSVFYMRERGGKLKGIVFGFGNETIDIRFTDGEVKIGRSV